jgi:hypothetical protein
MPYAAAAATITPLIHHPIDMDWLSSSGCSTVEPVASLVLATLSGTVWGMDWGTVSGLDTTEVSMVVESAGAVPAGAAEIAPEMPNVAAISVAATATFVGPSVISR